MRCSAPASFKPLRAPRPGNRQMADQVWTAAGGTGHPLFVHRHGLIALYLFVMQAAGTGTARGMAVPQLQQQVPADR